jgi:hypothetical protein
MNQNEPNKTQNELKMKQYEPNKTHNEQKINQLSSQLTNTFSKLFYFDFFRFIFFSEWNL